MLSVVCVCTQLLLWLEQENHGQMQAMLLLATLTTQMVHTLTACGVVCVIHASSYCCAIGEGVLVTGTPKTKAKKGTSAAPESKSGMYLS